MKKVFSKTGLMIMAVAVSIMSFSAGAFAMDEVSGHEQMDHHGEGVKGKECGCKHEEHHKGPHMFVNLLKCKLSLTDKQVGELSGIIKEEFPKGKPLFEAIRKEKKELRILSVAEKTDEAAIKAQAGKLADAEAALALDHARIHKRIAGILNPEQAVKFAELSKKFAEHVPGPGMHFKDGKCGHCCHHHHHHHHHHHKKGSDNRAEK